MNFDEETHTYTVDGKVVPSVTQVLSIITDYANIPEYILTAAAERGTYVHKMIELYVFGELGEFNMDYVGYLEAWKQFVKDTRFEPHLMEQRVYHPVYRYAGMLDVIGDLNGKLTLADIKTSVQLWPWVGPQTAGYTDAWNANNEEAKIEQRSGILLKPDGTYELERLSGSSDLAVFRSCLTIHNWRKKHL